MASNNGKTGLVYDLRMTNHRCLWNDGYPECPDRFTRILNRCNELNLIERCHSITSRPATLNEILLKHTQEHYDLLKTTDGETDEQKLEEMCSHYDIFIHPVYLKTKPKGIAKRVMTVNCINTFRLRFISSLGGPLCRTLCLQAVAQKRWDVSTFELSLLAVGCAIELIENILSGGVRNGMAVIRPPGHHAMKTRFDGFCFFNNVAIAAQHAIDNHNVKRILIVDFDVHHGQGTQQLFYDDPQVLYFSIHRYDHGIFFPGLRESDFDYVGEGRGEGYNFNVPLNKGGMTNADYLAIWQQILLPVAIEYQPELVLISAGFDAAYGCALGEMEITPACYAHLISPLMTLAEGKVAAFLEGGYKLESLAESAAITLKTFLGDPCPMLEKLDEPCDSVLESILNCTQSHKAFWKCLQVHREYSPEAMTTSKGDEGNFHQVIQKFIDDKDLNPWYNCDYYDTRLAFPNQTRSIEDETKIDEHLAYLKSITNLNHPLNRTCFVSTEESNKKIDEFLRKYDLLDRLHELKINNEERRSLLRESTIRFSDPNFMQSSQSAIVLELLKNVVENNFRNGFSIDNRERSFSLNNFPNLFFDNVALVTEFAIKIQGLKRVLIVDFGKNHLQNSSKHTNWNEKVLYISLDPYDAKDTSKIAIENGERNSINIPMDKEIVNDFDYVTAFQRIVMPAAYEFNPELVLVSIDFDAMSEAINISPQIFGYLTHWLSSLANGKIIAFMKGQDSIAMASCVRVLLGDALPVLNRSRMDAKINNIKAFQNVLSVQQKYWKSLKFNKSLPVLDG